MHYKPSLGRKTFIIFNAVILSFVTLIGVLPFIHLLAISLSSNSAAMAAEVKLWPVGFTTEAYQYLSQKAEFLNSIWVSVKRVTIVTLLNMLLVFLTAYPLSKENRQFKFRTVYVWFFAITMFFGGGLIPTYMVVKDTGLIDTIWALILPGALNVWNAVMMLNFFRGVPHDLEEAAFIDGASHWDSLWRIYLPVSLPAIATIGLFTVVGHWNSWFDGILYMNSPDNYPLQSYLSTLITEINKQAISIEDLQTLQYVSEKTLRTAQIFLGALPIMLVHPFLQRFFVKGITVGSVKE
ncbi:carbohydrate ABC transporter permease [Paenibacillus sp. OSY-SE]|uniref:carbohydrate ABC transporter permease n=1 Tax=Paenibacillus sp. OSY-SE TaxID=1196323 RepID=UPI00030EA5BC|nr:carbohydrate ABC transporter permease [Paenibacillus sp. OSY-SE]